MGEEGAWYFGKVDSIAEEGRDLLENYSGVPAAQVIEHVVNIVCPCSLLVELILMGNNSLLARQGLQSLPLAMHWSGQLPEQQACQDVVRFQDITEAQ